MKRNHGMSNTPTYSSWKAMRQRCMNLKNISYARYGSRGIKICKKWQNSFRAFYKDMGPRPPGLTLERRNNDGNYEPENCCWATRKEQRANTRLASYGPHKQHWFCAWHKDNMVQYLSNNQCEFALQHNLDSRNISACLCGKRNQHKGWTFRRSEYGT